MECEADSGAAEQKPFQNEEFLKNINTINSGPIQEMSTGDNSIKNDLLQILNEAPTDDAHKDDISDGSYSGPSSGAEDDKTTEDEKLFHDDRLISYNEQKPFDGGDFMCNICNKKCDDITDLTEHLASHSYKVFPCDVCHDVFFSKKRLKEHKKLVHPKTKKTKAKATPKVKPDKKEIISKTDPEDDKNEKATKEEGGKQNVVPNYYEVDFHKEFRCDHCHKAFDRKCNLVIHLKKYHAYTAESDNIGTDGQNNAGENQLVPLKQSLQCNKCEETFATEYLLKKHLKFVHQVRNILCFRFYCYTDPIKPSNH